MRATGIIPVTAMTRWVSTIGFTLSFERPSLNGKPKTHEIACH